MSHREPLPLEARKVLWRKVWDRLLQPIPSEVVVDGDRRADPPDVPDDRRDKELPR